MNRAKAGRRVRVLASHERPAPADGGTDGREINLPAEPVVGNSGESEVLLALDPFWTRGIVLPAAGETGS